MSVRQNPVLYLYEGRESSARQSEPRQPQALSELSGVATTSGELFPRHTIPRRAEWEGPRKECGRLQAPSQDRTSLRASMPCADAEARSPLRRTSPPTPSECKFHSR